MRYFTYLYSPATYEAFEASDKTVAGVRRRQRNAASRVEVGDKLMCYLTKLSRWVGVLVVESPVYEDATPIFQSSDDPFVIRFQVRVEIWLSKEHGVPIHDSSLWPILSFTKDHNQQSSTWTGKLRGSLVELDEADGKTLSGRMRSQVTSPVEFPIDVDEYSRLLGSKVRTLRGEVAVAVPDEEAEATEQDIQSLRESASIQAEIARIGAQMGHRIWIPRADRARVSQAWSAPDGVILDSLPLNYDEATLKTVELIDVIWLRGRSIVRAFEVEHTTSIYSGILRMADLLALQPNMDIKLHIVAPAERREKVLREITRPVFTLLEGAPLSERCTYLAYESIRELAGERHLAHLSDSVLDEYTESSD